MKKQLRTLFGKSVVSGGQPSWDIEERAKWYRFYRHMATFYDIEASTAESLKDVIKEAQQKGVGIIISYHNFERMVSSQRLKRAYEVCVAMKGDIFKAGCAG